MVLSRLRFMETCGVYRIADGDGRELRQLPPTPRRDLQLFCALTSPASTPWRGCEVASNPCRWRSRTFPSSPSGTCRTDRATLCSQWIPSGTTPIAFPHCSTPSGSQQCAVHRSVRTKDRQHLVVEHVAVVLDRAWFVLGSLQEPHCRFDQRRVGCLLDQFPLAL